MDDVLYVVICLIGFILGFALATLLHKESIKMDISYEQDLEDLDSKIKSLVIDVAKLEFSLSKMQEEDDKLYALLDSKEKELEELKSMLGKN